MFDWLLYKKMIGMKMVYKMIENIFFYVGFIGYWYEIDRLRDSNVIMIIFFMDRIYIC